MTIRLKLTGGACKHYEKSFRWYRFPCCGGCYPCPICHLESGNCDKAKNGEDVLANQMICGNCSDQMGYSESKPCRNCGFEFGLLRFELGVSIASRFRFTQSFFL